MFSINLIRRFKKLAGVNDPIFLLSYDRVGNIASSDVKNEVIRFITEKGDGKIINAKAVESVILFSSSESMEYWKLKAEKSINLQHITLIFVKGFSGNMDDVYFQRGKLKVN